MFKEYIGNIVEIRNLLIFSQLFDLDLNDVSVSVEFDEDGKKFYVNDVLLLKEVSRDFKVTFYCAIL
jgi:hypothetical protein